MTSYFIKINYLTLDSTISPPAGNRKQKNVIDWKSWLKTADTTGVPQGSVVGLLLYINDLPNYTTNKSTARLFADDAVIYKEFYTTNDT